MPKIKSRKRLDIELDLEGIEKVSRLKSLPYYEYLANNNLQLHPRTKKRWEFKPPGEMTKIEKHESTIENSTMLSSEVDFENFKELPSLNTEENSDALDWNFVTPDYPVINEETQLEEEITQTYQTNLLDADYNFQEILDNIEFYTSGHTSSVDYFILGLLELRIKHRLSKSCLGDFLKFMFALLPDSTLKQELPSTMHKINKYIEEIGTFHKVIPHPYQAKSTSSEANKDRFFYEVDIESQIKFLFEHRNLADLIIDAKSRSDIIHDITEGSEYIRINSQLQRSKYDLSLILHTDGISLSSSSKSHCWPVMFSIIEIPPNLRNCFTIINGVWNDKEKPDMNVFLRPFVEKLINCANKGIKWTHPKTKEEHVKKLTVALIIADAPARAALQNILSCLGQFSCNICEIETTPIPIGFNKKGKEKKLRVYIGTKHKLRDHTKMQKQAKDCIEQKKYDKKIKHIKGVKGDTVLALLPHLDLSRCFIPEQMHSVFLGCVRQISSLWFENASAPYGLKNKLEEIDNLLLKVCPPSTFHRLPRTIHEFKQYKAFEWYCWLMFYSVPILSQFLPKEHYQHWIQLVAALYLLNKPNISPKEINLAQKLLLKFVNDIPILYTERQCTYNVHQLCHLALCVKRWGPLWATSAFCFESQSGMLAHSVHGTKHIGKEIVSNLGLLLAYRYLKSKLVSDNENTKEKNNPILFGVVKSYQKYFTFSEYATLMNHFKQEFSIFFKIRYGCTFFTSEIYKKLKTNNYNIKLIKKDGTFIYATIKCYIKAGNKTYLVLKIFSVLESNRIVINVVNKYMSNILPVEEQPNFIIFDLDEVEDIINVVLVNGYICLQPHNFNVFI